ncbi:MAG: sensor histidine kinase [Acidimicrobiales bacterium]
MPVLVVVLIVVALALGTAVGYWLLRWQVGGVLAPLFEERRIDPVSGVRSQLATIAGHFQQLDHHQQASDSAGERRVRTLLDGFPSAILLYDGDHRLREANAAGERLLAGRYAEALVVGEARQLLDELTRRGTHHDAGPDDGRLTRTLNLAGPPRRSYDLSARRLSEDESLVVVEDITERRRLEDVRRDFVANISHELKTPLGAMAVLAETMLLGDVNPETGELVVRAHLAERLHNEALRMGSTIDDLLLLSRIESDMTLELDPVPLAGVVAEAISRVAGAAAAEGITIEAAVPADLLIPGERPQLVSAVYNLLDNAVKYSDRGQTVTVSAAPDPLEVALQVIDRGIGIPTKDLERIFERFYRVDRARSRRTGGTGLGLAIVRHVAHNHGGSVRVTSWEGQGSTFTLSLPALVEPTPTPTPAAGGRTR